MVGVSSGPALASDVLRACRLFRGLDATALASVAGALRVRRFRRGEVVFHSGDPGDALFIVERGQVKITLPADDGSEPAILTTVGPGGFFGELALLDGAPRSATAVAVGAVDTQVLRREPFLALVDGEPALRHALLATLAGEIRRTTAQLEDLHFLDLPGRLARHLLRMAADADTLADGDPERLAGAYRLAWPYTQTELASMIGGSRQSVNRLLADLAADGTIHIDGDTLVIPDAARLRTAARR